MSFIYAASHPAAPAFHPPSLSSGGHRAGNPGMTMVYMNLQPPDGTARRSPAARWSLTPPSHPCPAGHANALGRRQFPPRRLFSSAYTCCHQQLPFSEVERLVLPGLSSRTLCGCRRQAGALTCIGCTSNKIFWKQEHYG